MIGLMKNDAIIQDLLHWKRSNSYS